MRKYTWPLVLSLAFSLVLVQGCKSDNDDLANDTSLSGDLSLAGQDTAAQPQLSDVPPASGGNASAPTKSAPSKTSPPRSSQPPAPTKTASGNTVERGERGSEGELGTVAAGTTITLSSGDRICTNTHKPGDKFTATVTDAVMGSNGAVIPAGSKAVVQVTSVDKSANANDPATIGLLVQQIVIDGKAYPVDATIASAQVERERTTSTGNDAKKVIGGAVAGAILGRILGKDTKSTVIGAATGAAAGTAVAMGTADYAGCIPAGGTIAIKLNAPATIKAAE
jgi:hypothetical protein